MRPTWGPSVSRSVLGVAHRGAQVGEELGDRTAVTATPAERRFGVAVLLPQPGDARMVVDGLRERQKCGHQGAIDLGEALESADGGPRSAQIGADGHVARVQEQGEK